jgi:hypothetical protein
MICGADMVLCFCGLEDGCWCLGWFCCGLLDLKFCFGSWFGEVGIGGEFEVYCQNNQCIQYSMTHICHLTGFCLRFSKVRQTFVSRASFTEVADAQICQFMLSTREVSL